MNIKEILEKAHCFGYEDGMWGYRLFQQAYSEPIELHIAGSEEAPFGTALLTAQNALENIDRYLEGALRMLTHWLVDFDESAYSFKCISITDCLNCGYNADKVRDEYQTDDFYFTWWGSSDDEDVWDIHVHFKKFSTSTETYQPWSLSCHHA